MGRWDDVRLVPPEIALVSVQCVGNAKNVPPPLLRNHRQVHHVVDFTAYAELQGPTRGRMFPNGDPRWAGGPEWEAMFSDFVGKCELIMTKLHENKETHVGPNMIWFWCKAGEASFCSFDGDVPNVGAVLPNQCHHGPRHAAPAPG